MTEDILIVDDEADIRALVSGILEDEGYEAREAGDSDETLAAVSMVPWPLMITTGTDGCSCLSCSRT